VAATSGAPHFADAEHSHLLNVSTLYLCVNPIQHHCTKHVEINLHFVWERMAIGVVHILHMPMASLFADIFMKGLPTSVFLEFRSSLIHSG
jgi:hypothetical protein